MSNRIRFILHAKAVSAVPLIASLLVLTVVKAFDCEYISREEIIGLTTILSILVYPVLLFAVFCRSNKIDFVLLFVLLSWPFYFGQQFLATIQVESNRSMINIGQLSDSTIFNAGLITLISLNVLCLAYVLYPADTRRRQIAVQPTGKESLKKACVAVGVIALIPTLLTLYRNYALSVSAGYGARISESSLQLSGINNLAGIAAQFMPYALIGLFLSRKEGEKWQAIALFAYIALYMMTGSRTQGFILFIAVAVVWFSVFSKKSSMQQMTTILIASIAIAILFSVISLARSSTSAADFSHAVSSMMSQNNLVIDAVQEVGQTFVVLGAVYSHTPYPVPFGEGITYLSGISYIMPNVITGDFYGSVDSVDQLFAPFLTNYGGVGSSFISEAYYNFGHASFIVMAVFGLTLGKIQQEYEKGLTSRNYFIIFICVSCFMIFSFYIRSDVRTFFRNFVWNVMPILALQWVIWHQSRRKTRCRPADKPAGMIRGIRA